MLASHGASPSGRAVVGRPLVPGLEEAPFDGEVAVRGLLGPACTRPPRELVRPPLVVVAVLLALRFLGGDPFGDVGDEVVGVPRLLPFDKPIVGFDDSSMFWLP